MSLPARLITQLLELVSSRLALAQIEIEEARTLALRRLGWLLALGICSVLALQFGGLFLMLFYEGTTRLWMVLGLAATFLLLAVIAAAISVHLAKSALPWLGVTRHEIAADVDLLRGRDGNS